MKRMCGDKRGLLNIIIGVSGQVIMIIFGIIVPKMILVSYGSEINGLLNSVNQIFMYVSLLEAGVGTASIQALYRPIAANDKQKINEIMSATSIYYKKAGFYYLTAIVVIAVFYSFTVSSELSFILIFSVFLFSGLGNAINFFFQGKYQLYLQAEGKSYIISTINTCVYIAQSILKVIFISLGFSVVGVQFSYFLCTLIPCIAINIYIKRCYKWMSTGQKPDYSAIEQKNSVVVHQISALIFRNTDMLLLTFFGGLKMVSVYSIYNLIINYVSILITQVNTGFVYKLGHIYALDRKKYIKFHDIYELINMILVFASFAVTYKLIIPFIKIYTSGVNDIEYIDFKLPILFIIIQLLSSGRESSNVIINIAGHFRNTQYRSLLEAVINIIASIVGLECFGIYGLLLGTIIALLYRSNDMIMYSNIRLLKRSPAKTYLRWGISFWGFIISIAFMKLIDIELYNMLLIIRGGVIYTGIAIGCQLTLHAFSDFEVYKEIYGYLKRKLLYA